MSIRLEAHGMRRHASTNRPAVGKSFVGRLILTDQDGKALSRNDTVYSERDVVHRCRLQATFSDRFLAMLYAAVILLGGVSVVLFLVWLALLLEPPSGYRNPTTLSGTTVVLLDSSDTIDEVAEEEVPELIEARLSDVRLSADQIARLTRRNEDVSDAELLVQGPGKDRDERRPGIPRHPRLESMPDWVLRYQAQGFESYGELLKSQDIELVATWKTPSGIPAVVTLKLADSSVTRSDTMPVNRLAFRQTRHPFLDWDHRLFAEYGVPVSDTAIVSHFLSPATVQDMLQQEQNACQQAGRKLSQVHSVVFEITGGSSGQVRLHSLQD